MIKEQSKEWNNFLLSSLKQLENQAPIEFSKMRPSSLPETAGVYLITKINGAEEIPFYVGRTRNLRQRLYNNHLMGPLANARLKKYLIDNKICTNKEEAKIFIKKNCAARWIEEKEYRMRGAIESFFTAILFPEYGIDEEH